MAKKYTCDRCGCIIENYTVANNNVLIFNKNMEPKMFIGKCEDLDLCEQCQNDLDTLLYLFRYNYSMINAIIH